MYAEKSEALERYFKSIRHLDPLTKEDELDLAKKAKKGDREAIHTLVQHNLKIVVTIANKNIGRGILVDDLIQQGNIGLLEAALRFDHKVGVRFATFAGTRILKQMNKLIDSCGRVVRIPVNQEYERYLKLKKGEEVDNLSSVHLDDLMGEDSNETKSNSTILAVGPEVEENYDTIFKKKKVDSLLDRLSERDRKIVELYFGIGQEEELSSKDIAKEFGLTQIRVCQIVKTARTKMAESINNKVS